MAPDRLTCPICRDGLMAELVRSAVDHDQAERELFACLTCDFRGPLHVVHLIASERAELARFRRSTNDSLNTSIRLLAEDLRDRARAADRAAALVDDLFDVPARDGYRGNATAFRVAAREVEQLVGAERPRPLLEALDELIDQVVEQQAHAREHRNISRDAELAGVLAKLNAQRARLVDPNVDLVAEADHA